MAKLSFSSCFLLVLIVSASMVATAPVAKAATCSVVLKRSGCLLAACKQQCYQQKNGNGLCVPNAGATDYACVCNYICKN